VTTGEVIAGEVGGVMMKPVPVTVTVVPGTAVPGASLITGSPAVSPTVITAGGAGPGAPTTFVSMVNNALAHRAGLTFAQAVTVIGQETLPSPNVWHELDVWAFSATTGGAVVDDDGGGGEDGGGGDEGEEGGGEEDDGGGDGGDGVVKVPVRLPASSSLHIASSETSGLVIEQAGDWASATRGLTRHISTAGHSRITATKAVALLASQCRNVIALPLAAARLPGACTFIYGEGRGRALDT